MNTKSTLIHWILATLIVLSLFYGLNQMIMSVQGLPLNIDLTPAQ